MAEVIGFPVWRHSAAIRAEWGLARGGRDGVARMPIAGNAGRRQGADGRMLAARARWLSEIA